jgi:hypothetical protein
LIEKSLSNMIIGCEILWNWILFFFWFFAHNKCFYQLI